MSDLLVADLPIRRDPRYIICERAMEDPRYASVLEQLDAGRRLDLAGRQLLNMDGPFFHDTRAQAVITAPQTAITLAATDKLLYPGALTALPAQYFYAGKKCQLLVYGTITTAATPGNLGVELYYGTTDAGGTLLASSAALTLVASQTTIPFWATCYIKANGGAVPTAFPVEAYAKLEIGTAVIAAGGGLVPASAPAAVNIDSTAAQGFNVQFKRSGSTAETATTRDITFSALN
jgi:hypothetical protein